MAIPLAPGEKGHMYALGGVLRGGVGRAGYVGGQAMISIDGGQVGFDRDAAGVGVLIESLTIADILDETPNTCAFRVNGAVPPDGAEVIITQGSRNRLDRLFAGYCLTVRQRYAGKPANVQADVAAVDYTWLLGFQKVTKQYRGLSASAIVVDLVQTYAGANGFTTQAVAPNLPVLDEITFTDEDLPTAITRTMRRAGAYWYVDYLKDVHAFFEDAGSGTPRALTPIHPTLANVTKAGDRTQVLSRVYVEGRGSRVVSDVLPGDALIPLESADMFTAAADVFGKVAYAGSSGGAQHVAFTGVIPGGGGSLVGPGIGPSAAPGLAALAGAGVDAGAHDYAVTFVTAAGESLPGPRATITTGPAADPPYPPYNVINGPNQVFNGNTIAIGDSVQFAYIYGANASWPFTNNVTLWSAATLPIVTVSNNDPYNPTNSAPISMNFPSSPDPRVTQVLIYMYAQSRAQWAFIASVANQPTQPVLYLHYMGGSYGSVPPAGAFPPAANTTGQNQVAVSAIPIGSATVTARKLYRTAANQAPLKLLATIANNTATTYTDAAADAALGANVPASDTSGLQQPAGQVPAGSITLPVAGASAFLPGGGWAVIGNGEQAIRYTGISGGALTGIPASGNGAITATVAYNSTVTAPGLLTGIPATGARSITQRITAGDEIYLVVQADDPDRQAALASALHVASGVREDWIADRRLSVTEARARAQATLALRPLAAVTVQYTCRDTLTAAGKTITVNLPAPTNVSGAFKIQSVRISNFRPHATQYPTYTVEASSARFSFEDLLNRFRTKEQS